MSLILQLTRFLTIFSLVSECLRRRLNHSFSGTLSRPGVLTSDLIRVAVQDYAFAEVWNPDICPLVSQLDDE